MCGEHPDTQISFETRQETEHCPEPKLNAYCSVPRECKLLQVFCLWGIEKKAFAQSVAARHIPGAVLICSIKDTLFCTAATVGAAACLSLWKSADTCHDPLDFTGVRQCERDEDHPHRHPASRKSQRHSSWPSFPTCKVGFDLLPRSGGGGMVNFKTSTWPLPP